MNSNLPVTVRSSPVRLPKEHRPEDRTPLARLEPSSVVRRSFSHADQEARRVRVAARSSGTSRCQAESARRGPDPGPGRGSARGGGGGGENEPQDRRPFPRRFDVRAYGVDVATMRYGSDMGDASALGSAVQGTHVPSSLHVGTSRHKRCDVVGHWTNLWESRACVQMRTPTTQLPATGNRQAPVTLASEDCVQRLRRAREDGLWG